LLQCAFQRNTTLQKGDISKKLTMGTLLKINVLGSRRQEKLLANNL
jgi:hypothetical protein